MHGLTPFASRDRRRLAERADGPLRARRSAGDVTAQDAGGSSGRHAATAQLLHGGRFGHTAREAADFNKARNQRAVDARATGALLTNLSSSSGQTPRANRLLLYAPAENDPWRASQSAATAARADVGVIVREALQRLALTDSEQLRNALSEVTTDKCQRQDWEEDGRLANQRPSML